MDKKCFAFGRQQSCRALEGVARCCRKKCTYYKTRKQFESEIEQAYIRLASLDEIKQKEISDKYYGGKMPWKKGGVDHGC